jgi:DNA-directed RNA polymerase specialized sigma subunit
MGRSMSLNLKSSTSPFWGQYRRQMYNNRGIYLAESSKSYIDGEYDEIKLEEIDEFECMVQQLDKLDFYHKAIITDYFLNSMTYAQINKKYGISLIHLKRAVDNGLEIIRNKCKAILQ